MSAGHHGGDGRRQIDDILKRLVAQGDGTANRAYPEGRMGADDEGELALAVATDERHGTVVLSFNKPAALLVKHASGLKRKAAKT